MAGTHNTITRWPNYVPLAPVDQASPYEGQCPSTAPRARTGTAPRGLPGAER